MTLTPSQVRQDSTAATTPKTILLLRPDAIGDLVLFSSTIVAFRSLWPDARIAVLARSAHADLARMLVTSVEWILTPIDPFSQGPVEKAKELETLIETVSKLKPDLVLAACSRRTWLDFAVAKACPEARRVALASGEPDLFFSVAGLEHGMQQTEGCFEEIVPVEPETQEWLRGQFLAEHLVKRKVEFYRPSINIPDPLRAEADATLMKLGLSRGDFVVCAAAGFSNVRIKTWPAERFSRTAAWLDLEKDQPVLLVGHESEREYLEGVRSVAGTKRVQLWLGKSHELPLLAALLGAARLYFGNDTGAMHLAAAAGIPVLGLFGGGTWPRFRSAAKRSIDLVCPMPCFGCEWDCAFGNAPCVSALSELEVRDALASLLLAGTTEGSEIVKVEFSTAQLNALIEGAASLSRKKSEQLRLRQSELEKTVQLAGRKDAEIFNLKTAANEKDCEIVNLKASTTEKDREISLLKGATDSKDAEITLLKTATEGLDREVANLKEAATEKDLEIASITASAQARLAELADKDREIESISASANARLAELTNKDREIANITNSAKERLNDLMAKEREMDTLRAACQERLELIELLDKTVKTLVVERANLSNEVASLRQQCTQAKKDARDTEERYQRLSPDANQWAQQLAEAIAKITALQQQLNTAQADLASTQLTLRERDTPFTKLMGGMGTLDVNKFYKRHLRDKENVLQVLNRACQEREKLIRTLAMDATTPAARLRKLLTGLRGFWDARMAVPLRAKIERKILDGYWMQLGQLHQYEPKPVTWDRKLAAYRRRSVKGPRIGIVTPSYNQAAFLEKTINSILGQGYPDLKYVIQDGGSKDGSAEVIRRLSPKLHAWESARDAGQSDAIRRGFGKLMDQLAPDDVMAWVNSDDLLAPGCLNFVGRYFARHPEVEVIYGHRIIIDALDREIGRWTLPRHDCETLRWIDFVPQETLFWRKRTWDRIGGLDPSFQFALDWDFLLRIQNSGTKLVRVPYYLGVFRVHGESKTSSLIHTHGTQEMDRVRQRVQGAAFDHSRLDTEVRRAQFDGALTSRLLSLGIRR